MGRREQGQWALLWFLPLRGPVGQVQSTKGTQEGADHQRGSAVSSKSSVLRGPRGLMALALRP